MLFFPGSKINLGLLVGPKRPDGYHDIRSVFYRIPLTDILEVLPSSGTEFLRTGIDPGHPAEEDLVMKAWRAVSPSPSFFIHLHKIVPAGAGLGGGSADASAMLKAIKALWPESNFPGSVASLALSLGSDCPFFLHQGSQLVSGRGEQMTPHNLDLTGDHLVVIHQGIHISTAKAYAALDERERGQRDFFIPTASNKKEWKTNLFNDFELAAFEQHPSLKEIKSALYKQGAYYASMTGSGSAVFGLFSQSPGRSLPGTIFSGKL